MVKKLGSLRTKETAIQFHVNGSLCTGNMLEYHNSNDHKLFFFHSKLQKSNNTAKHNYYS